MFEPGEDPKQVKIEKTIERRIEYEVQVPKYVNVLVEKKLMLLALFCQEEIPEVVDV